MGLRNYLIEGVSGTGKTAVCDALQQRGYHALHGDRELRADSPQIPAIGGPLDELGHAAWVHGQANWDVDKVLSHIKNHEMPETFFCGGFRNHSELINQFDGVFVLEVDQGTLMRRLNNRPDDEFGGRRAEKELILRLHMTKEDIPLKGIVIDACMSVENVVDQILRHCGAG